MPYKQTTFKNYKQAARASHAAKFRREAARRAAHARAAAAYRQRKLIAKAIHKNSYTKAGRAANKFLRKHKNYNAPVAPLLYK